MKKALPVILGIASVGGIIFAVTRKAVGAEICHDLQPGIWYYFTYTGLPKTVKAALGACYLVIYTLDVYDTETDDWIPPVDPENNLLMTGSLCRVLVQGPCRLCGFLKVD